jgi:hypothetical protein
MLKGKTCHLWIWNQASAAKCNGLRLNESQFFVRFRIGSTVAASGLIGQSFTINMLIGRPSQILKDL